MRQGGCKPTLRFRNIDNPRKGVTLDIMFLRCFVCALIFLSPAPALAQGQSSTLSQVEAGIICQPPVTGSLPAPDTLAGATHVIEEEPPFVSASRKVPAALGIGFGVKAQSADPAGIDAVTITVTHPPMGPDLIRTQSFTTRISGGDPSLSFYQFDHAYELVTGQWTLTARADETVLYAIAFEVVAPVNVPELAGICEYLDLLS